MGRHRSAIGGHFGIADFDQDGRVDVLVSSAQASNDQDIPLRLLENRPGGFVLRALPDWNTKAFDSSGVDIGGLPRE